ncbi:GNAT family N-acetyltransferase [Aliivibrio fischeri]|uniref:GNAT family N-acetyltransferase n=1 Tax=Aliivibrio fischeri TaxID=668 RepID=UPI0007C4BE01|nr:GNAT family N-acetyltransferase [Aliivibrio fischeri]MCE7536076.1 GNAT family N-acetyltransferase [Aliivibrio fischeri]MCE7558738.1 GNAT family N-acetyltransferase [Aliivibrio fischeri]MCE7565977.1 GNAT family N-acetyltransferase [Aliivibrio fischeri]
MPQVLSFLKTVSAYAASGFIRYPILLEGSIGWSEEIIKEYIAHSGYLDSDIEVYGNLSIGELPSLEMKTALKKLGQETHCLVIDISHEFNANAINAVCGTLVGGGLVFFIRSEDSSLHRNIERWLTHFKKQMLVISENAPLPLLPQVPTEKKLMSSFTQTDKLDELYRSVDQKHAVLSIQRVITGHAKRPLIITADRGRGKSSAIGIAIAELVRDKKLVIGITAPLRVNINEVFGHAASVAKKLGMPFKQEKNTLTINGSTVTYFAPDELIRDSYSLDLLCIDEAAAIPAPMLLALTERYSRLVFSTTINGYEGTGRGFEIKFKKQLALLRPNFHSVEMIQPIRWSELDPLENWLSSVFLLDHKVSSNKQLDISREDVEFVRLNVSDLLTDPELAQSIFSLLVSAHYQTSPNDWLALLSDPSLFCWAGIDKSSRNVLTCALVSLEGQLDNELIADIQVGKRRPRGHLAPVSLTQTLCINEPAQQSCIRIMRIAVEQHYQRMHLGSKFIEYIKAFYCDLGIDYLSTSFGSTPGLNEFWLSLDFSFMRLGISKDKASGSHSLLAVLPLSKNAIEWLPLGKDYFVMALPEQLLSVFNELDVSEVLSLLKGIDTKQPLADVMIKRIEMYSNGGLGVEMIQYELRHFLLSSISLLLTLNATHQVLVVSKILQLQDWKTTISLSKVSGRREAEAEMRSAIRILLCNLHCKS